MTRLALAASAWTAILFASALPFIVWRVVLHGQGTSGWVSLVQLLGLGVILFASLVAPSLHPLRGFLLALIAFVIGDWIRYAIEGTPGLINWTKTAPQYQWIVLDSLIALIPGLLMAVTLIGSDMKRQDVFLALGNVSAPSKMPFGIRPVPWSWLGPMLIVVFSIPFTMALTSIIRQDLNAPRKVVTALPIILGFAVVNAASEEFRFRAVLLARCQPLLGAGHALLLTSTLFGLGHWFGHPSGPAGVVMSGVAGWFWAKSMIDTRGFFWAWLSHGILDVLILALVMIATP
jgi:CAAX protease family protein